MKKHIERGLAQVRATLEARYGGRGAWAVALLPVVGRAGLGGLVGAGSGAALSSTPLRAAAVLLLMVGVGVPSYLIWRDGSEVAELDRSVEMARLPEVGSRQALAPIETDSGRAGDAAVAHAEHGDHSASSSFIEPRPAPMASRAVRLVGLDGVALANATVEWAPSVGGQGASALGDFICTFETDADGRGSVESPLNAGIATGRWRLSERSFVVVCVFRREQAALLVLAPAVDITGRVVDHDGDIVEGAEVRAVADVGTVPGFAIREDPTHGYVSSKTTTGANGGFSLECIPTDPAFRLVIVAEGYRDARVAVPEHDERDIDLSVGQKVPVGRWITGTVLELSGAPAQGATVRFGWHEARADARGRFKIQVPSRPEQYLVSAESADGRFVTAQSPVDSDEVADTDTGGGVEDALVLRIPAMMGTLSGRLVDTAGEKVVGVDVLVFDGTPVGSSTAKFESGGGLGRLVRTDADGRFAFNRMADRTYRLRFIDSVSMLVHDAGPFQPGAVEHTIVLPDDVLVDVLRGHVVDVFGEPVRGAQIELRTNENTSDDSGVGHRSGRATVTDDEGRFELTNAPWRHISIVVNTQPGTGTVGVATPIGDQGPLDTIELEVELTCRVHLTVDGSDVTTVTAVGVSGESLFLVSRESGMTTGSWRVRRGVSGTFPIFYVSQRAEVLVLRGEGGEIDRVPVRLSATGVNEIQH